ncbi:Uncharacterized protein PODLI_1B000879, partial [Podarcis lilfordi]
MAKRRGMREGCQVEAASPFLPRTQTAELASVARTRGLQDRAVPPGLCPASCSHCGCPDAHDSELQPHSAMESPCLTACPPRLSLALSGGM